MTDFVGGGALGGGGLGRATRGAAMEETLQRRAAILDDLKRAIEAVSEVAAVHVNRTAPIMKEEPTPVVVITSGDERLDVEASSLGMEEWQWDISVDVIARGVDIDLLLRYINVEIMYDRTRGGNADDTERSATRKEFGFDVPTGAQALGLTYTVSFECQAGTF